MHLLLAEPLALLIGGKECRYAGSFAVEVDGQSCLWIDESSFAEVVGGQPSLGIHQGPLALAMDAICFGITPQSRPGYKWGDNLLCNPKEDTQNNSTAWRDAGAGLT